ncbi:Nif11-like leader peptide family natural product precursor [Nostoc sp. UHCC 0251]|nr:Nif11-like leader peptide family natural product precursor [Nostoc sp. UHCC 0251]
MLSQIQSLLQNSQLRENIQAAVTQTEAIKLLLIASAEKGYTFTVESIAQILSELNSAESVELTEEELLGVSGGMPLQHTNSCNHHYSCCW